MELERYVVPLMIFNFAEMGYVYATWVVMTSWMAYDGYTNYFHRKDLLMFVHHVMSFFICYWLWFFENWELMGDWAKVCGLLELSGVSTSVYANMSSKGYWSKMSMLSMYLPLRLYYVPKILVELQEAGACPIPLGLVWGILVMSVWWVKRVALIATLETMRRSQPMIRYLASF